MLSQPMPLQNQSQERRSANSNPLNDSIESEIPREEAHTVKLTSEKGLSSDR